jgi:regulator of sigma E protease
LYIFEIIIAIGLIIFFHELGHFASAKAFGVRVRKFALGMGPIIVKWGKGETEYSLRWVPVGGFVDLVGEHPEAGEAEDPRGLWRRPAWQKAIVFSAGVFMNAVLALALFALAPTVGVEVPVPVVGDVVEGMPAERAGIEPGDRIISVGGRPVDSFEDVIYIVALSNAGTTFQIELERPVPGSDVPERLTKTVTSVRAPETPMPMIGVQPEMVPVLSKIRPDSPLREAGLKDGDRVTTVNGRPVGAWSDMVKALKQAPPRQLTFSIERGGQPQDIAVDFNKLKTYEYGFAAPCEIKGVESGSPAAQAGIREGDRVVAAGDLEWPTEKAFTNMIRSSGGGGPIRLVLDRKGETIEVTCTPTVLPGADYARLGVVVGPAFEGPVRVAGVEPKGAAYAAGMRSGDVIVAAGEGGKEVKGWEELFTLMQEAEGEPLKLGIQRGDEAKSITVTPKVVIPEHMKLTLAEAIGDFMYVPLPRIYNPVRAAERGLRQTYVWFGRAYVNIKQLATGQVSAKMATGPVGIVQYSYMVASHGTGTLMDFMAMLSVFIAVLNFLPIPPFDGGHVLFVLIDKIKRKPVGLKTRTVVWIIGWAMVGLLFVVVTYRDIVRVIQTWTGG